MRCEDTILQRVCKIKIFIWYFNGPAAWEGRQECSVHDKLL